MRHDLGGPSMAQQPWKEEKAGPEADSRMLSIGKAVAWSGHDKDAISGPCEGRGRAPTGVTAPKRQGTGATEWHQGLNMASRHQPQEELALLHDVEQEEASSVEAWGDYGPTGMESTWLDFDEESAEEGEIRNEDDGWGGAAMVGWWARGGVITFFVSRFNELVRQ
ncbi:hypothetical protein NDU88_004287 [Pleurodeles waltl]|uniref:Uncharacterized protein n=1 Tax=Pleurodeles waltl TaxID=8319 RepID=A0AAV7SIF6_PLEWA|nr:hypothetical protein NDU88_004287 [Pleurodeles waltl]